VILLRWAYRRTLAITFKHCSNMSQLTAVVLALIKRQSWYGVIQLIHNAYIISSWYEVTSSCRTNQLRNLQRGLGLRRTQANQSDPIGRWWTGKSHFVTLGDCWCRRPRPTMGCRASWLLAYICIILTWIYWKVLQILLLRKEGSPYFRVLKHKFGDDYEEFLVCP
jgi:hypothetical protein